MDDNVVMQLLKGLIENADRHHLEDRGRFFTINETGMSKAQTLRTIRFVQDQLRTLAGKVREQE